MATQSPNHTKASAATLSPDATDFFIKKGRIAILLNGIQSMQKRDDISGKFARKCTQIGRALRIALEALMEEEKDLQELHKKKYPEGHADAGKVMPVFAIDERTGAPVFKKDAGGNDTTEREIVPGGFEYSDVVQYNKDRMDMLKEYVVINAPCFRVTDPEAKDDKYVPELDRFGKVSGAAWDACADFEEGSPCTTPPADAPEKPTEVPAEAAPPVVDDHGAP